MDDGDLVVPDCQRPAGAWGKRAKELYVGNVLIGGPTPPLWIQQWPTTDGCRPDELVDGLQRVSALRDFVEGRIRVEVPEHGISFHKNDVSPEELNQILSEHPLPTHTVRLSSLEGIYRLYLGLNRGGVPHSAEELARVEAMLEQVSSPPLKLSDLAE